MTSWAAGPVTAQEPGEPSEPNVGGTAVADREAGPSKRDLNADHTEISYTHFTA